MLVFAAALLPTAASAEPPPQEPNIHTLLDAAVNANLDPLRQALASASGRKEIVRNVDGVTVVHVLLGGLHTAVAGEISRLVGWSDNRRTLYRHDFIEGISTQIKPLLVDILKLSPELARATDARGRTPLHVAATEVLSGLAEPLLEAGARADATDHAGETPVHNAAVAGDVGGVDRLLRSLAPSEREAAAVVVRRLSGLAGQPMQRTQQRAARLDPPPPAAAAEARAALCAEGGGWDVEPPPTEAQRAGCQIDQRTALSEEEWYREYYLPGRPVLLRGVLSLAERCRFGRAAPEMAAALQEHRGCGRTAYPSLTGQKKCGSFSLLELNTHPRCNDRSAPWWRRARAPSPSPMEHVPRARPVAPRRPQAAPAWRGAQPAQLRAAPTPHAPAAAGMRRRAT